METGEPGPGRAPAPAGPAAPDGPPGLVAVPAPASGGGGAGDHTANDLVFSSRTRRTATTTKIILATENI